MSEAVIGRNHTINRSSMLFWLLWVVALSLPMLLWLNHTGNPLDYLEYNAPSGQMPYLLSKLCGLYAFSFLLLQIVLMVMKKAGSFPQWKINLHRNLGVTTLGLAAFHAGLFVTAKSIRGGHFAYDTLMPSFANGYYKSLVSIGIIVLIALLALVYSGFIRKNGFKHNHRIKIIHRIFALLSVSVVFHVINIGSEF